MLKNNALIAKLNKIIKSEPKTRITLKNKALTQTLNKTVEIQIFKATSFV